jgi:hypothetical protein
VADQEFALVISQVHAVSFAIAVHLAIGTNVLLHPLAMAVSLEAVVPHLPEAVFVDISLIIVGTDARTTRDASVCQHRSHIHSGMTFIELVSDLSFIAA